MWMRVRCAASSPHCTLRRKTTDAASSSTSHKDYAVRGYDFIESLRALGPSVALSRLKVILTFKGVGGATVAGAVVHYFTTRKYVLTTDPDPCHNTRYLQFPSDYAVVQNRWTGRRKVIELDSTEKIQNGFLKRNLRVNLLTHRVRLYLNPTESKVLVDAGPELRPDRVVAKGNRRHCVRAESAGSAGPASAGDGRLYFRATIRPLMCRNGYQKGFLPIFERAVETVARDLLAERFRACIASRAGPAQSPAITAELMRSGSLNGSGVTLQSVIGDAADFEREVMDRVMQRVGDGVVLFGHSMAVLQ